VGQGRRRCSLEAVAGLATIAALENEGIGGCRELCSCAFLGMRSGWTLTGKAG
jgi:hypothetical protein